MHTRNIVHNLLHAHDAFQSICMHMKNQALWSNQEKELHQVDLTVAPSAVLPRATFQLHQGQWQTSTLIEHASIARQVFVLTCATVWWLDCA
eukprot:1160248-Pelagomonas_calceolata.AAC.6